jgi:hypothetical protein
MVKQDHKVLRLKITLEHVVPAPWREIEIRSDKTLPHLHDAIQAAFLWYDMHLWDFGIGDRKYQMKSEDFWVEPMWGPPVMEVTTKKLGFFRLFRDLCGWTGFRSCAAPTRCCGVG